MDSSFWFDTIIWDSEYLGVTGYSFQKYCIYMSEDLFYFNSVDPDEILHNASFHLGLHCL